MTLIAVGTVAFGLLLAWFLGGLLLRLGGLSDRHLGRDDCFLGLFLL